MESHSCTSCEELAAIDVEILATQRHLANLNAQRVQICGRRNQAHDCLVKKLPPEVASMIFTQFVPINVDSSYGIRFNRPDYLRQQMDTTPLVLAAVCKTWRAIALSTQRLWASIAVDLSNVNDAVVDILREWLARSGTLPLFINIYRTDFEKQDNHKISDVFAPYSPRWFYLRMETALENFPCVSSNIAHALMLNTLHIEEFGRAAGLDLGMISNLRNLSVDTLEEDALLNVQWKNLTSLECAITSADMFFQVFSNASSLIRCMFYLSESSSDDMDNFSDIHMTPHAVFQLDDLVALTVQIWNESTPAALSWLKLPALQHLNVPRQNEAMLDLLLRSGCTLKSLETYLRPAFDYQLIPFIEEIPSLETLDIWYSELRDPFARASIDPLLTLLSTTSIRHDATSSQQIFLPNLKTLSITHLSLSWTCVLDLLLAYRDCNRATSTATQTSPESEDCRHRRPLCALHIQLWGKEDLVRPTIDVSENLRSAMESSSIEVTVADYLDWDRNRIPFMEFLEKSARPSAEV